MGRSGVSAPSGFFNLEIFYMLISPQALENYLNALTEDQRASFLKDANERVFWQTREKMLEAFVKTEIRRAKGGAA